MFSKRCKEHMFDEENMTRWQHFKRAMGFALMSWGICWRVVVHAFIPCLYTRYASNKFKEVAKTLK